MRLKSDLRYELKYLIRRGQMDRLAADLATYMDRDSHGNELGQYPITSLYYDSPDYKAYWDKLDGHRSRRKVRVRVYGDQAVTPATLAFLEVKERINSQMRKRRVALRYDQAIAFDDFGELDELDPSGELQARLAPADVATLHEVYYLYRTLQLGPACIVRYDRTAYEGRTPYEDLRVTFDVNLRGRTHDLSLTSGGYAADQLFLPADQVVLEVKANRNVPAWLVNLLSRHGCTYYRISKYCAALERSRAILGRQHIVEAPAAALR